MTIAVRVLALLLLTPVACAMAQSMEPRAYTNVPVGLNFLVVAYGYSQGEVGVDSSVPLQDGHTRVHTLPLVYVRSLAMRASRLLSARQPRK
jgi:hypothetical protein